MNLRLAVPEDSAALLSIYAQYIHTGVTFEYTLPSESEFAHRIREFSRCYPYLVCEENGRAIGYAYAHRAMERAAYGWNAELSVYLDNAYTRCGIGRGLYDILMRLLLAQNVKTVYGIVTLPNPASESLHLSMGFRRAGILHAAGYKNQEWRDVCYFEKALAPKDGQPDPLIPLRQLPPDTVCTILDAFHPLPGKNSIK